MSEDFSKFLSWLMIFAFAILFWEGFSAEMSRNKNISNVARYNPTPVTKIVPVQQNVYRQVYVNNSGGPATVYYVRQ